MKSKFSILLMGAALAPLQFMAKDTGGGGGGGGTGTGTGTGTKPATREKTAEKVEVKVDTKLAELFKKHDAAAEKAASHLVEIAEYVQKQNVSNAVLIKTIMEARGTKEASAKSQASRIRSILKDADTFQALKDGNVTVRAAVKTAQTRRQATPVSNQKAFDNKLSQFVGAAKALGQDRKTIIATVEAALEKGGIK